MREWESDGRPLAVTRDEGESEAEPVRRLQVVEAVGADVEHALGGKAEFLQRHAPMAECRFVGARATGVHVEADRCAQAVFRAGAQRGGIAVREQAQRGEAREPLQRSGSVGEDGPVGLRIGELLGLGARERAAETATSHFQRAREHLAVGEEGTALDLLLRALPRRDDLAEALLPAGQGRQCVERRARAAPPVHQGAEAVEGERGPLHGAV